MAVGMASLLALSAALYGRNVMTIGTVYLVFHYTALLRTPINVITRQMEDLQRAGGSIVRLQELQGLTSNLKERGVQDRAGQIGAEGWHEVSTPRMVTNRALSVTFEHVTFGYTPDTPVLHDISFQLQPGKTVGLLGRTGSGKSSLGRLLLRLYDPTQGRICLGHGQTCDLRQCHGFHGGKAQRYHLEGQIKALIALERHLCGKRVEQLRTVGSACGDCG